MTNYYRTNELCAILDCLSGYKLFETFSDEVKNIIAKKIEISINNATYDESVIRKIPQIWEDDRYVELYSNIGYSVKSNLDPNSYVNKSLETQQDYLAKRICYYYIKKLLLHSIKNLNKTQNIPQIQNQNQKNNSKTQKQTKNNKVTINQTKPVINAKCLELIVMYIPSINPKSVAYLTNSQLNPICTKQHYDEIKLREQQKINKKYTEMYPCPRCHARKATYYAAQNRGLDEDNTLHITCAECNHSWKRN